VSKYSSWWQYLQLPLLTVTVTRGNALWCESKGKEIDAAVSPFRLQPWRETIVYTHRHTRSIEPSPPAW
jgi:hypothetical protein